MIGKTTIPALAVARALALAPAMLALPLAGCISLGAKPPKALLTLTSAQSVPAGTIQSSAASPTITILVPAVPQSLATARVPVQAGDVAIAYVTDAVWVEAPQRMFARVMADTIAARTGRVVLSSAQSFQDPGARLSGELRNFGIDATGGGATGVALVTFDATLTRGEAGKFEKRRFEARVPVAIVDATTVGPALNDAANKVAAQVADWVGK
ncbi:ABC-type transport auxiliary lipoprotein family protein [uncultured Sphingomonas sp.]|uniref:ABC-type transport auxiliary lipoprotein family protein n=1 Tax=uncultured Sphingomonas sp. TaxID=158754 RepID=UPI0035C968C9